MSTLPVEIVETTLRDGTYEFDFQMTAEDSAFIASRLEQAGFSYIEICHGNGFGSEHLWAQRPKTLRAAATDEAYLAAAQSVLGTAKLGVIMVVGEGFTPMSAFDTLLRYGVRFVRLAFVPDTIYTPSCLDYIERAKAAGLIVSINLMQTYALSSIEVQKIAIETARRGADWFYVVDSAGGMQPAEVAQYVRAIADATPMRVGLHAHNNSALAMANSLAAVAAGATLLDSTLQGIGRATGNPSTEQLLLALQKMGFESGIDREAVLQLGDLARGLFAERGNDPTHFVSGAARMHSRYVGNLTRMAKANGHAAREFIFQVGSAARRHALWNGDQFPPAVYAEATAALAARSTSTLAAPVVRQLATAIARVSRLDIAAVCDDVFGRATIARKRPVLHLVPAELYPFSGPLPWETADLCGVTMPASAAALEQKVPDDRSPRLLVVDDSLRVPATLCPSSTRVFHSFAALVADAVTDLVVELRRVAPSATVQCAADETRSVALTKARLAERGIEVRPLDTAGARILLLATDKPWPLITKDDVVVLVAGGRSSHVDEARARGARILRPPIAAAIAGRATALAQLTDRLGQRENPTSGLVDPLTAAAGGDLVVDRVGCPSHIVDAGATSLDDASLVLAPLRAAGLLEGRGRL